MAGRGANLPFFPPQAQLTFLEPNPHMARRLRRRAGKLGRRIDVVEEPGERMPFADGSFDTVLTTLVLCSVADLDAVAAEIRRVLRPGGRFVFYEHVVRQGEVPGGPFRPVSTRCGSGSWPDAIWTGTSRRR